MKTVLETAVIPTPAGELTLVTRDRGPGRSREARDGPVVALAYSDRWERITPYLKRRFGDFDLREVRDPAGVATRIRAYLAGEAAALDGIEVDLDGTEFQKKVWLTLRTIPAGTTISYAELAKRVGRPTAFRAVGAANGANPVSLILPCHRVIRADGDLCGYGGGIERKRWLLAHEAVSTASRSARA